MVAILISDKIEFKTRFLKTDPEGHFLILKGRNHQEDINTINIYAPNIGAFSLCISIQIHKENLGGL